jgi:ribosomal protein S18 acetylase RimI-like enzyme
MNMQDIIIRAMQDADISAASAVVCECYKWLAQIEGYTVEETARLIQERGSIEAITSQKQECHFIVAEFGGEIAGVAAIFKNIITKLYIAPQHFRKGIGSRLFDDSEKYISDTGYTDIFLGAFPVSAGFYEAKGMELEETKITAGGPIKGRPVLLYRKSIIKTPE